MRSQGINPNEPLMTEQLAKVLQLRAEARELGYTDGAIALYVHHQLREWVDARSRPKDLFSSTTGGTDAPHDRSH